MNIRSRARSQPRQRRFLSPAPEIRRRRAILDTLGALIVAIQADDRADVEIRGIRGGGADAFACPNKQWRLGGCAAKECQGQGHVLVQVAQRELRWSMPILDQAGPSRLQSRHHALKDPEDVLRIEARILARDLELRGGEVSISITSFLADMYLAGKIYRNNLAVKPLAGKRKINQTGAVLTDEIDRIAEQWKVERPELDVSPTHILQRITRLSLLQQSSFAGVFSRHGLTWGEYLVLATLRRAGAPYRMNPTELYGAVMLSSGGMTKRLDRLERAGFVERLPDATDRRGRLVALTTRGREVVDLAVIDHLANEERLLGALSPRERQELSDLLRRLLSSAPFQALDPTN